MKKSFIIVTKIKKPSLKALTFFLPAILFLSKLGISFILIFNLFALSAAAGMKCEYCIVAHTAMAKKAGATQEEIKTAIMVAGVVSLNSTVMYGNQYNQEKWRKMFE